MQLCVSPRSGVPAKVTAGVPAAAVLTASAQTAPAPHTTVTSGTDPNQASNAVNGGQRTTPIVTTGASVTS